MTIINSYINVNGGGSAPAHYIGYSVDENGQLKKDLTIIDLTGVTDIKSFALYSAYYKTVFAANTSINLTFPSTVNGTSACEQMFDSCENITSVTFRNLTIINGGSGFMKCFNNNTQLLTINLPDVQQVKQTGLGYFAAGCQNLISFQMPNLEKITVQSLNYMCQNCSSLSLLEFPSLSELDGVNAMRYCCMGCHNGIVIKFYALTPSSFGSYTNQFNRILYNVSNGVVHFPMAIQSTIGSWSDVTDGFGGTNTTVLFDIVTTLTGADTNSYVRKQKESTSTATAWTYNDTLYYTSGTSEPSVGATIYSDSACTTSVTTISAIA